MSGLTRDEFTELWTRTNAEAQAMKDSQGALMRLTDYYRHLDKDDRQVVDDVLISWILKGDKYQRYDALATIRKFEIRSALPSLRENLTRLEHATGPSVPDDREQLEEIIAGLE